VRFKYLRYVPNTLRPVIPIEVQYGDQSARYEVLVDSGADMNVFGVELGEFLGIDVASGEPGRFFGATGVPETYYRHSVRIIVDGRSYHVQAAFSQSIGKRRHGIVGQQGFFDLFKVTFDLLHEDIELMPVD
jgi:Aspartyl protease